MWEWQQFTCKNKSSCPFLSFSMLPSLPQMVHTNMRAVPRLHCTGRKGRPEWVFRSVIKTPINSFRNDPFRINITLVIMWQPVWTRSCTKLIQISCKRPFKSCYSQSITLCSPVWILKISVALKLQLLLTASLLLKQRLVKKAHILIFLIQRKQKSL